MAILFPVSLDTLLNPSAGDTMDAAGVFHDVQHSDANDAIEALEAKVGVTNSAVTTSLDYLLRQRSRGATLFVAANDASTKVKDSADYVCDGTNDEVQWMDAIDALPSIGGKVLGSEGIFNIANPILIERWHVALQGMHRSATTGVSGGTNFKPVADISEVIKVYNAADLTEASRSVTLMDFRINGDKTNRGGATDGIHFSCFNGGIYNVGVVNMRGHGIRSRGGTARGTLSCNAGTMHCIVANCDGHGIFYDTNADDNYCIGNVVFDNLLDGLRINASNQIVIGNHFYANRTKGIYILNAALCKVLGNKIEHNYQGGLYTESVTAGAGNHIILGNGFSDNTAGATNTHDNLRLTGLTGGSPIGCSNNVIVGNYFIDDSGRICRAQIGLFNSQVYDNVIIANNIGGTNKVIDNTGGQNNFIRSNAKFVTENNGTGVVPSGSTSVVINHGLNRTPTASDIQLTPTNNWGNATKYWISNITSTQFTVNVNANPGATTFAFSWQATVI